MFFAIVILLSAGLGVILIRYKNKGKHSLLKKDLLDFAIGIIAAFMGLYTTFYLDNYRSNLEKKNHLKPILLLEQDEHQAYSDYIDHVLSQKDDSSRIAVYSNNHKLRTFPYMNNITDPVIYDVSTETSVYLRQVESNVPSLINEFETTSSKTLKLQLIKLIGKIASCGSELFQIELQYLNNDISAIDLAESRKEITERYNDIFVNPKN